MIINRIHVHLQKSAKFCPSVSTTIHNSLLCSDTLVLCGLNVLLRKWPGFLKQVGVGDDRGPVKAAESVVIKCNPKYITFGITRAESDDGLKVLHVWMWWTLVTSQFHPWMLFICYYIYLFFCFPFLRWWLCIGWGTIVHFQSLRNFKPCFSVLHYYCLLIPKMKSIAVRLFFNYFLQIHLKSATNKCVRK